jgi:large subunit ribosomal protein L7/L12
MASEKITAIVESVKTMTVLELKELVDTICEEFGVSRCRRRCCSR